MACGNYCRCGCEGLPSMHLDYECNLYHISPEAWKETWGRNARRDERVAAIAAPVESAVA